ASLRGRHYATPCPGTKVERRRTGSADPPSGIVRTPDPKEPPLRPGSDRGHPWRRPMQSSRELRDEVISGDITGSFRLWRRSQVRVGGRYPVGPGYIEVDAVELMPFSAITPADLRRSGEKDMESLRQRAAHAGPITDDTLLYRVEFHVVATR